MVNISSRLKSERKRLELTQDRFAELAGVAKRALSNYESGGRSPDADFLAAIGAAGADVLYILTGERSSSDFTQSEIELIHAYRNTTSAGRAAVHSVLSATTPNSSQSTQTRQVFRAPVGQVIEENVGTARASVSKK